MQVEGKKESARYPCTAGWTSVGIVGSSMLLATGLLALTQHRLPTIRLGCLSTYILKNPKGAKVAGSLLVTASTVTLFITTANIVCSHSKRCTPTKPKERLPVATIHSPLLDETQCQEIRQQYPPEEIEWLLTIHSTSNDGTVLKIEQGYPDTFPIEGMHNGKEGKKIGLSRDKITVIHKSHSGKSTIYTDYPVYYEKKNQGFDENSERYFLIYNSETKNWSVFRED